MCETHFVCTLIRRRDEFFKPIVEIINFRFKDDIVIRHRIEKSKDIESREDTYKERIVLCVVEFYKIG